MGLRAFTKTAVLGALTAAVLSAAFPVHAKDAKAALVGLDDVIQHQTRQTFLVIGRLVPQRSGVVSVLTKGPIAQMNVRVGDRVEAGDVMARLTTDSLSWAEKLREAEMESAKAQMVLRKRELQRLSNLKKSAAFSAARFEDAQQELSKAESDAARAQASLNIAKIDLYNAEIRAPYPGVVSVIHTEIGTYLNIGSPVVTLVDDTHMEIEADVPADRTPGLSADTPVTFSINGQSDLAATVRAVVPSENPLTRTRTVRFTPGDDMLEMGVAANQTVNLQIPAGPAREVVSVHKDAVLTKSGKRVVFIVEDGKANVRPVGLGEAVGTRFIVKSGLKPGDQVVVRGNERLRPGQEIQENNGTKNGTKAQ
ncbi:efflux RND transporter periplasmic adaptor subunit [Magnetovibrio sp. PR-2]|uniref:efflux RND transporter periplasmic adaptor subunit n=1 Tax=Magnetovibrio sp. PR-2 TaxID=3120356 RepID=UPI002FCE5027